MSWEAFLFIVFLIEILLVLFIFFLDIIFMTFVCPVFISQHNYSFMLVDGD